MTIGRSSLGSWGIPNRDPHRLVLLFYKKILKSRIASVGEHVPRDWRDIPKLSETASLLRVPVVVLHQTLACTDRIGTMGDCGTHVSSLRKGAEVGTPFGANCNLVFAAPPHKSSRTRTIRQWHHVFRAFHCQIRLHVPLVRSRLRDEDRTHRKAGRNCGRSVADPVGPMKGASYESSGHGQLGISVRAHSAPDVPTRACGIVGFDPAVDASADAPASDHGPARYA
jgi:hypothetical protein